MKSLEEMSGAELLARYNELSPTKRRAKFETKEDAIKRIKALTPSSQPPAKEKPAKEKKPDAPKKAVKEPALAEAKSKTKNANAVIRLLASTPRNPRREGSEAHAYYERMRGSITVGEYLDKFPEADRRKARQWLYNTIKDGHAELLGG